MKWSIRLKFLIVMSGLLGLCLGSYLFMAVTVFKSDKTQLVFDLNRSQVANLTSELETQFGGVSQRLKLFTLLPNRLQSRMADDLFTEDSDIVAVSIYKDGTTLPERSFHHAGFLETYGLSESFFTKDVPSTPIPFESILRQGEDIWNASVPRGPPLIGYGRLVILQDENGFPVEKWAVVGFVKLDRFLKSVSAVSLSKLYVSNRRGEVLVHPDPKKLLEHPSVARDPLFQEAVKAKTRIQVTTRELESDRVLAAAAKGFNDQIYVVATASESQVFQVVRDLSTQTLLFGSIVLTLVILAAFLLSRTLTENIERLVEGMGAVSKGDLTTHIRLKGRDETVLLANSFNRMIHDLKESRDALEEMNRELDQKVKERTEQLEIQNQKVKDVQETLLRTTRLASVGEIAGRTAHEVLNPLTILLTRTNLMQKRVTPKPGSSLSLMEEIRQGWIKDLSEGGFEKLISNWRSESRVLPGKTLLQEDLENMERVTHDLEAQYDALQKDVRFIREEGERIGKIINNMRRLGRLNSHARPYSLHAILTDCCDIMADLFDQKGFIIERRFDASNDSCVVDRDEIIQSVTNLMRNSLQALEDVHTNVGTDALPESSFSLRMTVSTYNAGDDDQICIDFEDNGIGIPQDHQARLFESTFTTKSPDEGTGLGLGISRRFVRSHGGDIEFVVSKPREKTVFRIKLPVQQGSHNQGVAA